MPLPAGKVNVALGSPVTAVLRYSAEVNTVEPESRRTRVQPGGGVRATVVWTCDTWASNRSSATVPGGAARVSESVAAAVVAARKAIAGGTEQVCVTLGPDGGCSRSAARVLAGFVVAAENAEEAVGSVRTGTSSPSAATGPVRRAPGTRRTSRCGPSIVLPPSETGRA